MPNVCAVSDGEAGAYCTVWHVYIYVSFYVNPPKILILEMHVLGIGEFLIGIFDLCILCLIYWGIKEKQFSFHKCNLMLFSCISTCFNALKTYFKIDCSQIKLTGVKGKSRVDGK